MGKIRIKTIETEATPEKLTETKKVEEEPKKEAQSKIKVRKPKSKKGKIRSKKYQSLLSLVEKNRNYPVDQAIDLIKKVSQTKFDAKIEAHVNLGLDLSKPEHKIKVLVDSPTTKQKKEKILVFCSKTQAENIKGKDDLEIGGEDTIKEISKGKVLYDKIVATPEWMSQLVAVAKILGPKGLMPNPKNKTLVDNPQEAFKASSGGQVEMRIEKEPIIHLAIGRVSDDNEKIKNSLLILIRSVKEAKPEKIKRNYLQSIYLNPTMGPSVRLDLSSLET